jgi:Cu(I)/Ag(I) efflux system membrane fusion protein
MEKQRNNNIQWIYIAGALLAGLLAGFLIFSGPGEPNSDQGGADHNHAVAPESQMWTCSMHPQIMQPEPGNCPICGMELIPAGTGSEELGAGQIRMTENAMTLADIRTTRVGEHPDATSGSITLSGEIVEDQEAKTVQASYFDGRIESLNIHFKGQQIQKGQQLATLYAPGLVAAQQELLTAASLKESQPGLYQAVRKKLKYWKLTDQQIDQIESSSTVQEYFPVYATVSGTVIEMMVTEGDYVKKGQPLARLSNLNRVWADLEAYENQLELFNTGQEITITTNAYAGTEFSALITFIDPVLDTRTRTVTVRAVLANTEGLLKPGMFVTGLIAVEGSTSNTALTVPASAVMWTGERSLVYVKTRAEEPVFEMREVTLGNRVGDSFVIESGLEAGAEIVTHGTFTVDAAAQLQGKRSMMNAGKGNGDAQAAHPPLAGVSEKFLHSMEAALSSYLELKDALVASDPAIASEKAGAMRESLPALGEDLKEEEREALSRLEKLLSRLSQTTDLSVQRTQFRLLSEGIIEIARPLGTANTPLYLQFCPMANDNRGAYWISRDSSIRNPYYGDAMLTCGEVRATWSGN